MISGSTAINGAEGEAQELTELAASEISGVRSIAGSDRQRCPARTDYGRDRACHGEHDVRFKGQECHRRCPPQTLLQKNGHAGRSLHSVLLRPQIQRCGV